MWCFLYFVQETCKISVRRKMALNSVYHSITVNLTRAIVCTNPGTSMVVPCCLRQRPRCVQLQSCRRYFQRVLWNHRGFSLLAGKKSLNEIERSSYKTELACIASSSVTIIPNAWLRYGKGARSIALCVIFVILIRPPSHSGLGVELWSEARITDTLPKIRDMVLVDGIQLEDNDKKSSGILIQYIIGIRRSSDSDDLLWITHKRL